MDENVPGQGAALDSSTCEQERHDDLRVGAAACDCTDMKRDGMIRQTTPVSVAITSRERCTHRM